MNVKWYVVVLLTCVSITTTVSAQGSRAALPSRVIGPAAEIEQLPKEGGEKLVTIVAMDSTLAYVVTEMLRQVNLRPVYNNSDKRFLKRVSVRIRNRAWTQALNQVLDDAGLVAKAASDGETVMIRPRAASQNVAQASLTGIILGRVTDSATARGLDRATVTVIGTKLVTQTQADGAFRFPAVPVGAQRVSVRLLGYATKTMSVVVDSGRSAGISVALRQSSTTLSEVVTTVTGNRSRLEVGTDIGTIKVDSILDKTLIRNVSDLLQARLPGVSVTNSSGAVGAPSRIRIRGINSIGLNNDPIVVMDGVRLNSSTTDSKHQKRRERYVNNTFLLAPSRLDDIDPNTIESIDVLRGPSAASLYGTEAANGVIVIKTKRAKPGPVAIQLSASRGWTDLPSGMPEDWYGDFRIEDGRRIYGSYGCPIFSFITRNASDGTCHADSLWKFNAANDPEMTTIGRGKTQQLSLGVSGGSDRIQQNVTASFNDHIGSARMSRQEERRVSRLWGAPPPPWLRRPNTERSISGLSTTSLHGGSALNVTLSTSVIYRNTVDGGTGMSGTEVTPTSNDTLNYLPTDFQRQRRSSVNKRGIGTVNATLTPARWLGLRGGFGGDFAVRNDITQQRSVDCATIISSSACTSNRTKKDVEEFSLSVSGGAMTTLHPLGWIELRTSVGGDLNRDRMSSLQAENVASTLAFGSDLLSPYPIPLIDGVGVFNVEEERDEAAVAGWYAEQTISSRGKVFLTASLRFDAASAFGPTINENPPPFPKFALSWLVSDEPWFPKLPAVRALRLRSAYGRSGKQASQAMVLAEHYQMTVAYDSARSATGIVRSSVGNSALLPERTGEWEGGMDVSVGRVEANLNLYRKVSDDAIMEADLAPSYGAATLKQYRNVGSVQNNGFEVSTMVRVLETRRLQWTLNVGYSRNSNLLSKASPDASLTGYGGILREGYPVFGSWAYPLISYVDMNGDGLLSVKEAAFGDSLVFYSAPYPKNEINYNSAITTFNGALTLTTLITQVNELGRRFRSVAGNQCQYDRSCTIDQQAAAMAIEGGAVLPVNSTRLAEMSISYAIPQKFIQKILRARSGTIALSGRNLALWTKYVGKDPNVNMDNSDVGIDDGKTLPQTRQWSFRFSLGM